ncbi:MAG: flagellar motor switch protein FliG [Candidatus Azotimanducaceae bacterium]
MNPTVVPAIDKESIDVGMAHLTGAQKAAIVLLKLGRERSVSIMKLLGESEVSAVTAEIVQAHSVRREDGEASLIEFATRVKSNDQLVTGGVERARDLLTASVGQDRAHEILGELRASTSRVPFAFLRKTEPRQVLNFLSGEHPQTVALVLAHLPSEAASVVLSGLDHSMQRDVSIRVAKLQQTSPEVISQMEDVLQRRFGVATASRSKSERADGVQTLINILNLTDRATERAIFEGLEEQDSELAENVRARMFVFEDVVSLDDKAIQLILRSVDAKDLATALKGVKPNVREKITSNMSERAATNLEDEIQLLGSIRMKAVEEAQGVVVRAIRTLEETGEIVVNRGAEEFVT